MMKRPFLTFAMLCVLLPAVGEDLRVDSVRLLGPFCIQQPMLVDSVDAAQKRYAREQLLDTPLSTDSLWKTAGKAIAEAPRSADSTSVELCLAGFEFDVRGVAKLKVEAEGPSQRKVFVDGVEARDEKSYLPGRHRVMVRYMADTTALNIQLKAKELDRITLVSPKVDGKRPFSMADNMEMYYYSDVSLSATGRFARVKSARYRPDGTLEGKTKLSELATGRELTEEDFYQWMPRTDRYLSIRKEDGNRKLYSVDPATNTAELLCAQLPEGWFSMSPTEDFLIVGEEVKGPDREQGGVYEILDPDDRQPGNRNRTRLSRFDLRTGVLQPLTFGHKKLYLYDLSSDGKYMVFGFSRDRLTQRPTTLTTLCRMDLSTLKVDTLVKEDGFMSSVQYIPGTQKLLVTGSAEAFGRIGCTLPNNLIPNEYDYQLYLLDADTKEVKPLTRDFDPSIQSVLAAENNRCFFTAENKDSISLYRMSLDDYSIQAVDQPCEVISRMALSNDGSTFLYYGSGACSPNMLYRLTFGKKNAMRAEVVENLNAARMKELALGTCKGFEFQSKNGYKLTGHYYLPANFDEGKKYPVIVHYYGGCSPTSRRFGGGNHYPAHYWNALGYVVLIVNPSGASGFGQEWASRHVNTMGEGVAEDIIEATEWLAKNEWIDKEKIGCVSASYGGFMTQLLLTKTDLYAAGISHAGISDHTSYWGEGYWGYSYSEVSAANSYPWTRKDLYVDRSPLYNADKIHRPLLFTHGSADTNVPIGESIQMYTALKLLGVPTAFVVVEGENHHIMDFHKRQKWINTMVAWFDRWLKGDDSWWKEIYSPKEL